MFGLTAASLGLSALSSIFSYGANKKAIAQQKALALQSADLTREQATLQRQESQRQAALSWENTASTQMSQIGAYTAGGVLATSGSALSMLQETRKTGLADYNVILTTGENKAAYMESQANLIEQGANINAESANSVNTANLWGGLIFNVISPSLQGLGIYLAKKQQEKLFANSTLNTETITSSGPIYKTRTR